MNILINATIVNGGGSVAVTDSICSFLNKFDNHHFIVVLSSDASHISGKIKNYPNVEVFVHDIKKTLRVLITNREPFMDDLVKRKKIDVVLTTFGPSYWTPRCKHLCGFARPHLIYSNSPYFNKLTKKDRLLEKLHYKFVLWCFKRNSSVFFTENSHISNSLQGLIPNSKAYTITGYYHQIYNQPSQWSIKSLPVFNGTSMLTVAMPILSKNLPITVEIAKKLKEKYPQFSFRFVMTLKPDELEGIDETVRDNFEFIGRVKIEELPTLYQQTDIMFMPTLLECFSATYAEAMKMERPIVTTDLGFAHGICGDAAKYYSPISAVSAADAIYEVATNKELRQALVNNGKKQLKSFDTSEQRAEKLINIVENL